MTVAEMNVRSGSSEFRLVVRESEEGPGWVVELIDPDSGENMDYIVGTGEYDDLGAAIRATHDMFKLYVISFV